MKVHLLLSTLTILLSAGGLFAQDDPYHVWLRQHLSQEYGVAGGGWVLGDTETATHSLAEPSAGVTTESFLPSNQEFSRALRLTVPQASPNPWDRTVRFPIQESIAQGDVLLLCVWLRHEWPAEEEGLVETIFEITESPYTKSLLSGYNVPEEWTLFLLPFENDVAVGPGGARFQLNMGRQKQITDLGGLALLNFGTAYDVDDLPKLTSPQTYGGRNPDASWRAPAEERIEAIRMNDFEIIVVGESGDPVENAEVHVTLKRHAFGFGTAIATGLMTGSNTNQVYRDRVANLTGDGRTFNIAVLENALKWGPWENDWPVAKQQKATLVAWLISRGMDVRGHNLVWPSWQFLPDDIEQNQTDLAYITDRIESHIKEEAGHSGLKGFIREWDVVNEPTHTTDLRDIYRGSPGYPTGEEIYADWFRLAEEADPDARLFVNEYAIVNAYGPSATSTARPGFKRIIRGLIDANVRLDGIGIQSHMSSPLTPIDTVYKVLEEFGSFGLGISISEYDASDVDEEVAADYMRDFLTMAFSHPAVESFLMWGFWDGAHWYDDAPIFRQDWSIKPSGQAFIDLVFDRWWTDEVATTDAKGLLKLRGFLGDYEIVVTHGEKTATNAVTLAEGEPPRWVVSMATTGSEVEQPAGGFAVQPNFPNPFSGSTSISFTLPRTEDVRIRVFDVTGRQVSTHELERAHPGMHSATIDLHGFPSGGYVYMLEAGVHSHTGYLAHMGN